jgi:ferrous iron transport protein A
MRIKDLRIGEQAEIVGYEAASQAYRSRLLAMGLTKGTVLKLVKLAPLGDPLQLEVRGFNLSLRKNEAEVLSVRRLDGKEGRR